MLSFRKHTIKKEILPGYMMTWIDAKSRGHTTSEQAISQNFCALGEDESTPWAYGHMYKPLEWKISRSKRNYETKWDHGFWQNWTNCLPVTGMVQNSDTASLLREVSLENLKHVFNSIATYWYSEVLSDSR